MTTPPWQPPGAQPSPYGGPPHQPNPPYQQAPPQQAPFPPFPQQQPPYGRQPFPGSGWGQPPMGPPPQKDRGKAVAIAVVAVVVAAGVVGVLREAVSDGGTSTGTGVSASPEYKLRLPQTLDGGTYTLGDDLSAMIDERVPDSGRNTRNVTPVAGQYGAGSGTGTRALVFTGYYGTFDNPEQSKAAFLKGVSEGEGAEIPAPPKTFTPAGADEDVTCEVMVKHESGQRITVPLCVWVDNGTLGSVMETDATSMGAAPESIDLQSFADRTGRIRDEVRVPLP